MTMKLKNGLTCSFTAIHNNIISIRLKVHPYDFFTFMNQNIQLFNFRLTKVEVTSIN
jgi:hypothetical protein